MKTKPILGLISALIIAALGVGVYVIYGLSGNQSVQIASQAVSLSEPSEASCKFSAERGKLLDEAAVGELAAFRAVEEPLDMTFIEFNDKGGSKKTLADWNGTYVLFNLWATWCPPCREEMPFFEELQATKSSDKFQVIPVSIDLGTPEKPKAFYEEIGLKALPFFQDPSMEAFQQLRKKGVALGMPTTLLIDTNGCALGVLNGPAHWSSPDAINLIDAALSLEELS